MASVAVDTCAVVTVPANSTNLYSVIDLSLIVTSILFQVHTDSYENIVNAGPGPPMEIYLTGSNVGFVQPLKYGQSAANCMVSNPSPTNTSTIQLCSTSLNSHVPIPGGCAQEFALPMVPTIRTLFGGKNGSVLSLNFEPANGAYDRRQGEHNCDDPNLRSEFAYHLYGMFIGSSVIDLSRNTMFNAYSEHMSAKSIVSSAKKICTISGNEKTEFTLASVSGKPLILNVIVENLTNSQSSAYISILTFGCADGRLCNSSIGIESWIFLGFVAVLALLINFFGHKYFRIEQLLIGWFLFGLTTYIIFENFALSLEVWKIVLVSCSVGLCGGISLFILWWFYGFPILNVLFATFSLGFVMSSITFYFVIDPLDVFRGSRFNQIIAFVTLMVGFALIVPWTKYANILGCSVVGSACFVWTISIWSDSTLHYVLIRTVQRLSDVNFSNTCSIVPYFTSDIILSVLWLALVIGGCTAQYLQTKNHAPFPPCPYETVRFGGMLGRLKLTRNTNGLNETSPLIINESEGGFVSPQSPQSYGATEPIVSPID